MSNTESACRTCLKISSHTTCIFDEYKSDNLTDMGSSTIVDLLNGFLSVEFDPEDGLPVNICTSCVNNTVSSYLFKRKCEKSYAILKLESAKVKSNIASNDDIANKSDIKLDLEKFEGQNTSTLKRKNNQESYPKRIKHDVSNNFENRYHCAHCQFKTGLKANLQTHMRVHTGEKPFLCDECDLSFKQMAHLKTHKLIHRQEKLWPCHLCHYRARLKRHLDNHLRKHTGEKPFMCDKCSFTTAYLHNLRSHQRSHNDFKMYKCDRCDYSSNFKKNLNMHAARHTGQKTFVCHLCDYKGSCSQNLKAHMISHSQVRLFACPECKYHTKTKSMLNKHMKTHSLK